MAAPRTRVLPSSERVLLWSTRTCPLSLRGLGWACPRPLAFHCPLGAAPCPGPGLPPATSGSEPLLTGWAFASLTCPERSQLLLLEQPCQTAQLPIREQHRAGQGGGTLGRGVGAASAEGPREAAGLCEDPALVPVRSWQGLGSADLGIMGDPQATHPIGIWRTWDGVPRAEEGR